MFQDTIEREIFIQSSLDHVWSLISKTGFWVGEDLRFDVDAQEGDTVVIDAPPYGWFPVKVERLDPPSYAAYRWASAFPGTALTAENSTLIEISLTAHEGGVLLNLKESGFATLDAPHDVRAAQHAGNGTGWNGQLERLRRTAEAVPVP